jgi:hypothetical protein
MGSHSGHAIFRHQEKTETNAADVPDSEAVERKSNDKLTALEKLM